MRPLISPAVASDTTLGLPGEPERITEPSQRLAVVLGISRNGFGGTMYAAGYGCSSWRNHNRGQRHAVRQRVLHPSACNFVRRHGNVGRQQACSWKSCRSSLACFLRCSRLGFAGNPRDIIHPSLPCPLTGRSEVDVRTANRSCGIVPSRGRDAGPCPAPGAEVGLTSSLF
jgi:hypothetical protein